MTDRELLELAAKAAGMRPDDWRQNGFDTPWNPLASDGDALRLAVKLEMCVGITPHPVSVHKQAVALAPGCNECFVPSNGDMAAATRRAIVRAAAVIGERV